jgi:hypothetical protein
VTSYSREGVFAYDWLPMQSLTLFAPPLLIADIDSYKKVAKKRHIPYDRIPDVPILDDLSFMINFAHADVDAAKLYH